MSLKLDDFLSKKKEPAQVLDLSRVKITSQQEFKKYLEKVPEYKIKPEKVGPDTVRIREKDWGLTPGRREAPHPHPHQYLDPTPPDMKTIQLSDLCPVTIDWKMLTTLRPKTKLEENLFSRLVQLGKLSLKHQQQLSRSKDTDWVRKSKNPRSSIVETRVVSCAECGEDFCDGSLCSLLMYDNFVRPQASVSTGVVKNAGTDGPDDADRDPPRKHGHRRRGRTRQHGHSLRLRKNSIFNRAPPRGCTRDHSRRERHAATVVRSRSTSRHRTTSAGEGGPASIPAISKTKRRSRSKVRAKTAPSIRFKGLRSSDDRRGVSSCSCATDGSDTETEPAPTTRRFIRHCTLTCSNSGDGLWCDPYRRTANASTSDSSLSPPRAHVRTLRPATVHLELGTAVRGRDPAVPCSSSAHATGVGEAEPVAIGGVACRLSRVHLTLEQDTFTQPPGQHNTVRRRRAMSRRCTTGGAGDGSRSAPVGQVPENPLISGASDDIIVKPCFINQLRPL